MTKKPDAPIEVTPKFDAAFTDYRERMLETQRRLDRLRRRAERAERKRKQRELAELLGLVV